MSVYNGRRFLREAIASILTQTMTEFEFIIINDGSIDDTAAILASYDDRRLRIIHQENTGLAVSLNRGLEMARTELVARMDADDIALPNRLETQLKEYERLGRPDVLGGYVEYICESGYSLGTRRCPLTHQDIIDELEQVRIAYPHVGIVLLLVFYTAQDIELLRKLALAGKGGMALFLKQSLDLTEQLFGIIMSVSRGQIILDPLLTSFLLMEKTESPFLSQLTARESEILGLLAKGYTNSAIADALFIDINTYYLETCFAKSSCQGKTNIAQANNSNYSLAFFKFLN